MTNHEQITEIIDDMDLNRPFTLHIESEGRNTYRVQIECATHHLTCKVFQSEFNRISATVCEYMNTDEFVEFIVKSYVE